MKSNYKDKLKTLKNKISSFNDIIENKEYDLEYET